MCLQNTCLQNDEHTPISIFPERLHTFWKIKDTGTMWHAYEKILTYFKVLVGVATTRTQLSSHFDAVAVSAFLTVMTMLSWLDVSVSRVSRASDGSASILA